MPRLAKLCSGLTAVIIASGAAMSGRAAEVGIVEYATAGVSVKHSDVPVLKPGTPIDAGDSVRTGPTSFGRIVLAGGASVLMQPDSELRVVDHDARTSQTRIELVRGQVAQKKRWDDAAKQQAATAMNDMWRLIQIIVPPVPR